MLVTPRCYTCPALSWSGAKPRTRTSQRSKGEPCTLRGHRSRDTPSLFIVSVHFLCGYIRLLSTRWKLWPNEIWHTAPEVGNGLSADIRVVCPKNAYLQDAHSSFCWSPPILTEIPPSAPALIGRANTDCRNRTGVCRRDRPHDHMLYRRPSGFRLRAH